MAQPIEHFIETVDRRHLHELDWPIVRLLARSFVERLELQRYKRHLVASGRWDRIRAVPHRDGSGGVSPHVFDLYGLPAPHAEAATSSERDAALPSVWPA